MLIKLVKYFFIKVPLILLNVYEPKWELRMGQIAHEIKISFAHNVMRNNPFKITMHQITFIE